MDGLLLLDKPKGMTSHDCVNRVRRIFQTKKVGHAGTLDPDATGVLVVAINRATKILQFLEHDSKVYEATITLGTETTTEDASGEVVREDLSYKTIQRGTIEETLSHFLGPQIQVPPMISAVKVKGKKLYEYARENKVVMRPERKIEVHRLTLLDDHEMFTGNTVSFRILAHVSKGTYIRTLATDIGKHLGYPAHLSELRRIQSGSFTIDRCVSFETLEQGQFQLLTMKEALSGFRQVSVSDQVKKRILNGQKLHRKVKDPIVAFLDHSGQVLAVYGEDPKDPTMLKPLRVLATEKES